MIEKTYCSTIEDENYCECAEDMKSLGRQWFMDWWHYSKSSKDNAHCAFCDIFVVNCWSMIWDHILAEHLLELVMLRLAN